MASSAPRHRNDAIEQRRRSSSRGGFFRGLRLHILLSVAALGAVLVTAVALNSREARDPFCSSVGSKASRITELSARTDSDSTAIQAAIEATAREGGGIIQLSAGQFLIHHPIILKDNVALRGSGPETVLKAAPDFLDSRGPYGGFPLITTDGARDVTISHFTADQSGDDLDGNVEGRLNEYLIDVRHSSNALVDNVVTINPFTYSIAVVGSNNFCVSNSSTVVESSGRYDQLDGIHITDSNSGIVVNNQVDQRRGEDGDDGLVAQTIGAAVHDVVYRDNDVRGGSHGAGMQLAVSGYEIYNITIENNRFWGSPSGIRTGYYEDADQPVHDVEIKNNSFIDLDGLSANLYGQLWKIRASDNRICRSGGIHIDAGAANTVEGTINSCEI